MEIVTMSHRYRRVRQDTAVIQASIQIALEQAQAQAAINHNHNQTQVEQGTSEAGAR
jgi:hypothetical protein